MSLFVQVLLPVISIFILGYILQKFKKLDVKSVSSATIYIFIPALVFRTFYEADLRGEFQSIILFSFLLLFSIILLNKLLALILRWDKAEESAMILGTAFMNAGNYGAPVILFAFGEEAFVYAVLIMTLQTLIMNFFGVYYASRGQSGFRYAMKAVMKMPATYAIIVALTFKGLNVGLHENVEQTVGFLADSAIPLMMVVLGMQLANISFKQFEVGKVVIGSTIKLVVSPLIALAIIMIFPVPEILGKIFIIIAAMPTAATTTMYALEFRARPDLVSSITLITTLLSVVTTLILLAILV